MRRSAFWRISLVMAVLVLTVAPGWSRHALAAQEASPTAEPPGDVPMYRGGPARTGALPGPALSGQPELLWRFETTSPLHATPAIVDGIAYVPDGILGGGCLRAIDAVGGHERWAAPLPGQPFGSSPAVADGMVFVGDLGGNVTGVNIATGEVIWSVQVGGDISSSPAVVDGTLFIRNGEDVLVALDAATGGERWRFATGGEGGYTLDTAPAVADGVVYMTTIDSDRGDSLFALDAATGAERWRFAPSSPGLYTPAVVDGVVYAGGDGGLYAVDAVSGGQLWNAPIGEVTAAPAVGDGTVLVHTRRTLVAVDAVTGQERWQHETGGMWSAPTLVAGVAYVGSHGMGKSGLHVVDVASGELLWLVRAIGDMNASPVVTGGVIYAGSDAGMFVLGSLPASSAPVEDRVLTTLVGRFTFASELDANGTPVDAGSPLPSGIDSFTIVYDFAGVSDGAIRRIEWFLDGEPILQHEEAWVAGRVGRTTESISATQGTLPDGTYEAVLYLDGTEVRRGQVTVGGR